MSLTSLLTDRTTIETDWTCQRKRWWYREWSQPSTKLRGIIPLVEAEYYRQGRELHADYAALAIGGSAEVIIRRVLGDVLLSETPPPLPQLEHAWWHASMVAAFAQHILPKWLRHFRILMVEKEITLERPPLTVACTGDLVLIGIEDGPCAGEVVVIDFKTLRWLTQGWVAHWPYAVQMLINAKAVEELTGREVKSTYVIGVQKGQVRGGQLRHPYTYAYHHDGDWRAEWTKLPHKLTPRWEKLDGSGLPTLPTLDEAVVSVIEWVEQLGETVAIDLHPQSAPILANDRLLNRLIRERTRREQEIEFVREKVRENPELVEVYFPSSFSSCRPTHGDTCPYLAACHNAEVEADPIGSGLFVSRTPHHDLEWLERNSE